MMMCFDDFLSIDFMGSTVKVRLNVAMSVTSHSRKEPNGQGRVNAIHGKNHWTTGNNETGRADATSLYRPELQPDLRNKPNTAGNPPRGKYVRQLWLIYSQAYRLQAVATLFYG